MMGEHKPDPAFQDVSAALSAPQPRPRRWLMPSLVVLYAASALAAVFMLARGGPNGTSDRKTRLLGPTERLLAAHRESVGWVVIHGPIYGSSSGRAWERGMEQWNRRIKSLSSRGDVKAIVLDINSPGGSVGAVQELYQAIHRVREENKKPVVALVGDVAASGGYYLAAACDRIVAHPGSLVGSIGVIFNTMDAQQLLAKIGLKTDPVKSGKMKDIGSPARAMTKEERELLQGLIDDAFGQFLQAVSKGRGLPEERIRPLADGRIFSGRQAMQLGLVDQLGDSQDALTLAAKLGGISGKPKVVRDVESFESVLEMLGSDLSGFLRPEAAWLSGLPSLSTGLEYRWTGI